MKLERRRVSVRTPRAQDARRTWPERESLLLRLTDAAGHHGVGEASPLPDYSPDRLDDIEPALAALDMPEVEAALAQPTTRAALAAVASLLPRHLPSARMALETAALDLLGQRHRQSAPLLLGAETSARRPLAQLLGAASSPTLQADAERALQAGFRHLKLKLGAPGQLPRELAGVQALRERHGESVVLRLDANGALSATEIEQAWRSLSGLGIELFEEPGRMPDALLGTLPLGLDESLQGLDESAVAELVQRTQARYVVLKPMALGGLVHCWRLADIARALGVLPVLSHCFDGPYAWRAAAALALALPAGPAHGLSPHAGLDAWRLRPLPVSDGFLELWPELGLGAPAEPDFP
jgi:L-alanine-DL-glutamate epimerase-like enolase superfamily enzyme